MSDIKHINNIYKPALDGDIYLCGNPQEGFCQEDYANFLFKKQGKLLRHQYLIKKDFQEEDLYQNYSQMFQDVFNQIPYYSNRKMDLNFLREKFQTPHQYNY